MAFPRLRVFERFTPALGVIQVNPPLVGFSLRWLGIPTEKFVEFLAPTFHKLPWDLFDVRMRTIRFLQECWPEQSDLLEQLLPVYYERGTHQEVDGLVRHLPLHLQEQVRQIRPCRQRSLATLEICRLHRHYQVTQIPNQPYIQKLGKLGTVQRVFHETPHAVVVNPLFQSLVCKVAGMVAAQRDWRKLIVKAHQISTVATREMAGLVVPERTHQDGADYIVSLIVVERTNIIGGESVVLAPLVVRLSPNADGVAEITFGRELHRQTLEVGQGIFQDDRFLWHDVTPVTVKNAALGEGRRSGIGFDVVVVE